MNNRVTMMTMLVIASLMASPIVVADDTQDIPTNAQNTGVHDSLVAALSHAGLVSALQADGPFTVFAPTDDAFAAAGIDLSTFDTDEENATLSDILLYHVVSGSVAASDVTDGMSAEALNGDDISFTVSDGSVMVNGATVTTADVMASNGIIHVIDMVLMPPADLADIPTVAQGTGIHTSLVAAVVQAELLTTLQGDGPFTVFAPTDDAFAAAGIDLAALDTEEGKAALTDILLYHVVSGAVPSSAVTDGMSAAAVNGDDLSFTVGEGVMVNDANVVLADVPASNGVIHVIDKVLMPPADEPVIPEGCDYVIGIDESGYAYDETDLSIDVGQTVCWIWEDESMGHNVAQIEDEGDTSRMLGGKYSGMAMMSVDYRVTFDEDQTFLYICEPHATMDMVGKVVVGTGVMEEVDEPDYDSETDSVPGFTAGLSGIALAAAVIMYGGRKSEL
ncbi:MAG: fasciclin domain-containing protein [Candidatus Thalassarchaeaceae archaeon]